MEDFSEMLGGIATCSIPFLDLPTQFLDSPEIGAGFVGYSEIFNGFSDKDFAINYQEFISEGSVTSNGRVQVEVKEFLDHSTEDIKYIIPDIIGSDLTEKATQNAPFDDGKQEIISPPSSIENSKFDGLYANNVPVDYSSENVTSRDATGTTVSGINLHTQPSTRPVPTKTPPKIASKHNGTKFDIFKTSKVDTGAGLIKQTRSHQIQYKVGDSNCGNSMELDAQSAVAAMKEAMEQAQARIKHAKEIMEKRSGGIQCHKQLGHRGNTKHDERKERKTSEEGKLFNVEDECCVVTGVESELMGQKVILESSQINYKLEEISKEQKTDELYSELVSNDRSKIVKEHFKPLYIESKLKSSSNINKAMEMNAYDGNSKDGASYGTEIDNLSDDGNKKHALKEIKGENNRETLSTGGGLINISVSEEIPFTDDLPKLDSLNAESLLVKPLDDVSVFQENLLDVKEDGIMHAARNDFDKCTVGILESFDEKHVSKNDAAFDVNRLKGNPEELKPELEVEKTIEREHEKVQAREAEEKEFMREGEKNELIAESKYAKAWERAKRMKNKARQKVHNKVQKQNVKAEISERQKIEKALKEAKLRAERAAAERATAEAREQAVEKALADAKLREENVNKNSWGKKKKNNAPEEYLQKTASSSGFAYDAAFQNVEASTSSKRFSNSTFDDEVDPPFKSKGTLERHQTAIEHAEKVLAEKNMQDILAQREQEERNKLAESLDADINRWSRGKEGNLRALLSTLQFILGPDSGWQPVSVTDVFSAQSLKRAYRKATLCVHPDKLQQRGASVQQKYICEKVFDLLKEAWDRFSLSE